MSDILETKSSSATLVDTASPLRNPSTPHSIISTAFCASEQPAIPPLPSQVVVDNDTHTSLSSDPLLSSSPSLANASALTTAPTLRDPPLEPAPFSRDSTISTISIQQAQDQWNQIVSSSLTVLASQFSAASRQLAVEPPLVPSAHAEVQDGLPPQSSPRNENMQPLFRRLEAIERTQSRLKKGLENVHLGLRGMVSGGQEISWKAREEEKEIFTEERLEDVDIQVRVDNLQSRTEGLESRMEALEKTVAGAVESIKLEWVHWHQVSRLRCAYVTFRCGIVKLGCIPGFITQL